MVVRVLYTHGRLVEEPQRAHHLIVGLRAEPAANQAQPIPGAPPRQLVRRLSEMFAEVLDGANVSGFSQRHHVAEAHVVGHTLRQR